MSHPLIGSKVDDVLTTANLLSSGKGFRLGQRVQTYDGKQYVWCKNASSNAVYSVVQVDGANFSVVGLTTTSAPTAEIVGVLQVAMASDEYGWVQVTGRTKIKVSGLCAKNIALWTTATAGQLDDATASTYMVQGINLLSTNPSSTATALSAFILNPSILKRAGTA
jgi:hypothetical protein